MKIFDISTEINEQMPVYKNKKEKRPKIHITRKLKDGANESKIEIDSHTGTHADSYFHILARGKTIEKINPEKFIGSCIVLDFTSIEDKITDRDFSNMSYPDKKFKIQNPTNSVNYINELLIRKDDIVLLKTRTKPLKNFDYNFKYLAKSGAEFLAEKEVKCIGIDNLGIERNQPEHDTHKILFKKGVTIIEGLELSNISPGRYFFIGLPLKIKNGDASPIRAVLIDQLPTNNDGGFQANNSSKPV
jgi:arylformamidase